MTVVGPVSPFRGGIALHTDALVKELLSNGNDVRVESWAHQYPRLLFKGFQPRRDDRVERSSVYFRLSWWNPFTWVGVGLRNRGRKFILVGVTPFQYPIFLCILLFGAAILGRRSVVIAHNVTPHETSRFDRFLTALLFRTVGSVVTHSNSEYQEALRFQPNCRLARLPYHGPQMGSETPPFTRTNRILFLGYVREYKGLDLLIAALSRTENTPSLIVAGEFWQPMSQYQELCELHQLAQRVEFRPGYVEDTEVPNLLDQVDLLVLPYRSSTATQLPAIARARRTPTIVTPVGDLANSVEHGKNGIVASGATTKALAEAIDLAYKNLRFLSDNCSEPRLGQEWEQYLGTLLKG